jgi:cyclophilin family peptidyl-prolyl cis-trans isomerase
VWGELSSDKEGEKVRALLFKNLLWGGLAVALVAALAGCGGDDNDKLTIKAGPTISVSYTPFPTVVVPEGSLPTRVADFASSCQKSDQKQWSEMPAMIIDPTLSYTAVIKTEKGDVTLNLLPDIAPWTVNNFVFLACKGFYDNLTFHRVFQQAVPPQIPHPFVQAGDPSGRSVMDPVIGGPGYYIPTEISDHKFLKGTVGMASRGLGTPAVGSQFFIVLEDSPEMDGQSTVFGEVVAGFEVLKQVTPRNPQEGGPPGDKILTITIQEGPSS